ncbi:MAG: hypothetical protein MJE68_14975, partial [Proteobacteria bacterium]|nr:hypothetical protein [Pseudomonadota bacterium]
MLQEVAPKYSGDVNSVIPSDMKYPEQFQYGEKHKHLNPAVKRLKLRSSNDFNRVNKYLEKLDRVTIQSDPGNNNMLDCIRVQLHIPSNFTNDMMWHQVASYMIEIVDFLYPKMEEYLKKKNLSFNAYVMGVYSGVIWADEFVLGVIGKMYNIRISVVSPFYSDVWNVFHDGIQPPDVVLVANGMDFGGDKMNIAHFTATKGAGKDWKCVGHDISLQEVGHYIGYSEGMKCAVDFFTINETCRLLEKSNKAVHDINKLCDDVHRICIDRDKMLNELKKIDVKVKSFRRLTTYYTEDEYDPDNENQGKRKTMPVHRRTTQVVPSTMRAIPKIRTIDSRGTPFGQQLIQEALDCMEDDYELAQIHSPTKRSKSSTVVSSNVEKTSTVVSDDVQKSSTVVFDDVEKRQQLNPVNMEKAVQKRSERIKMPAASVNLIADSVVKDDRRGLHRNNQVYEQLLPQSIQEHVQKRRVKIKVPVVRKPKPGDIAPKKPPVLPSLGIYEKYVEEVELDNVQTTRTYKSGVPHEEYVEDNFDEVIDVEQSRPDLEIE